MAFCTNCGATVNGAFCPQCGQPAGAATGAAPAPAPGYAPAAGAPKKKTSPIVWILIILVGLFVLGGIAIVGAGLFVVHKVKQAGLDPELMQKNPALAMSKLIATANPNLEVLNVNERRGIITVREKDTGKVVTLNFDDVKKGRIVVQDNSEGKSATMEFGDSSAKLPSWLPAYPGAKVAGTFAVNSGEGEGGSFSFSTRDAPAKIVEFYQDGLKQSGFKINTTATSNDSSMLAAEDESTRRTVMVTVGSGSEGNTVTIVFGSKK
jgi:hypothetical protein